MDTISRVLSEFTVIQHSFILDFRLTEIMKLVVVVLFIWTIPSATGCNEDSAPYCLSRFHNVPVEEMTQEQHLLYRLMRSYDRASRPVYDAGKPVDIKLGISLTQVLDVDEKNQVLTVNVWLDQDWVDERLVWANMSEYSNIKILRIPCDLIWLPDIVLYNSVDSHNKGYMKSLAMVHSDGHVFWPPIVRMRSSCKMDITFFPFDDQICKLKMGSWAYDGFQVDVSNRSVDIDLNNFVDNGEWTLIDTKVQRNVLYYPCCPEPFPDVTFYIQLRRRVLYYFLNVIIPCILLSCLTLSGFLLPPDSGEKITLGLTVLLAFSVFMLLIAENMPPTSEYIPLIGVYLTIIMAMSALSVVFSVCVLNFHHKRIGTNPPPYWLKALATIASHMTCSKISFSNTNTPMSPKVNNVGHIDHLVNHGDFNSVKFDGETDTESREQLLDIHSTPMCVENQINGTCTNRNPGIHSNGRTQLPLVETMVLEYVNRLLSKYDRSTDENRSLNDWREIARIFDRVLFVIFGLITVISTLTILVICPFTKSITIEGSMGNI